MKTKNILIGILSLLTFSTYAQSTESIKNIEENENVKLTTTELNFESNNLEDFSNLYWNMTSELLKRNDPNQEVILTIAYNNSSKENKTESLIDDFKAVFKGKTSELMDLMTSDLKKSLATLYINNGFRKN